MNKQEYKLKFIDLFAGIGGFHYALQKNDMECVFASEIDFNARKTYSLNHNISEAIFNNDIRAISVDTIPNHDILCAGFPCQPFSQAGYKKGFNDGENSERGNLFFCIVEILENKRPKAFILENVRHLLNHDNGKTFKIIQEYLTKLNYSIYYKILKASDFGKPQHRPRIYIVGFDNEQINTNIPFQFPNPIPLQLSMSDIWGGLCSREIGFTLRVGGRGSNINDRRNWDSYLVDGVVKKLGPTEGIKMMGFPNDFILPSSETQAMKQLGNSVCVDVVYHVAKQVKQYIINNQYTNNNQYEDVQMAGKNKGEWSEIYTFLNLMVDNKVFFGDKNGRAEEDYIKVYQLQHNNSENFYDISDTLIEIKKNSGELISKFETKDILTDEDIIFIFNLIKSSQGSSFKVEEIKNILDVLQIKSFKGKSDSKGDIIASFMHKSKAYEKERLGIKSHIGSAPTLLNSSGATNFLFEVEGFTGILDDVNTIDKPKTKIRDRIKKIEELNGKFKFISCENITHEENLRKIDSQMPEILSEILLRYYQGKAVKISDLVTIEQKKCRVKDYLKNILLGMFSTIKWDGNRSANGYILLKCEGSKVLFHVIKEDILKDYLFEHTKLDTPSSTRHRFGLLYKEKGKLFIKLNLQIRFL